MDEEVQDPSKSVQTGQAPSAPKSVLPKSLTTVTPFSKAFASALFVLLPIVGFALGIAYERNVMFFEQDGQWPTQSQPPMPEDDTTEHQSSESNMPVIPGVPTQDEAPAVPTPGTGIEQDSTCGVTNCHGYDITCGDTSEPIACTMEYRIGDGCRQFAVCGIVDGVCAPQKSERFDTCVSCAQNCEKENAANQIDVFSCESKCYE